jgi:hypothetical protein
MPDRNDGSAKKLERVIMYASTFSKLATRRFNKTVGLFLSSLVLAAQSVGILPFHFPSASHLAVASENGPTLSVNAQTGRTLINEGIYGITFFWSGNSATRNAQIAYANAVKLPLNRLGGNAMTRYNWQVDSSNSGFDWYYMGGSGISNPTPGASRDADIATDRSVGAKTVLTIPVIGYINKKSEWHCSFPKSVYGSQQSYNPYVRPNGDDCGNGVNLSGNNITDTNPTSHDIPNSTAHQQNWIRHLIGRYGTASQNNGLIYQLDNEPSNWDYIHRDVHPNDVTKEEVFTRNRDYAAAIKAVDAAAEVAGPSEIQFAWYPEWNGETNSVYYLQNMRQYEQNNSKRILDTFAVHYPDANVPHYPTLTHVAYVRQLVDTHYPGTKIAFDEWTGNGADPVGGALFTADQLGLFARHRISWAGYWGMDDVNQQTAFAFRMYRNYNNQGGRFGETYVGSSSTNAGQLALHAAQRTSDGALTVMVINKNSNDLTSTLSLAGFNPASIAQVYRYSNANKTAIVRVPDQTVSSTGFSATYPANSITLLIIPKSVTKVLVTNKNEVATGQTPPNGSLRWAVETANAVTGSEAVIGFDNVALGANAQINLLSPLVLNSNVIIEGSCGSPVRLNASFARVIQLGGGNRIRGLHIFGSSGPIIGSNSKGNRFECTKLKVGSEP